VSPTTTGRPPRITTRRPDRIYYCRCCFLPYAIADSIASGDTGSEPIPGLDWNFLAVEFGAVLDYSLDGNADRLDIKLSLDACGTVLGISRCMSYELPADFPIEILDATINFGECASKNAVATIVGNATLVDV